MAKTMWCFGVTQYERNSSILSNRGMSCQDSNYPKMDFHIHFPDAIKCASFVDEIVVEWFLCLFCWPWSMQSWKVQLWLKWKCNGCNIFKQPLCKQAPFSPDEQGACLHIDCLNILIKTQFPEHIGGNWFRYPPHNFVHFSKTCRTDFSLTIKPFEDRRLIFRRISSQPNFTLPHNHKIVLESC